MARKNELYSNILSITTDYLGPAAPRFIDRQIQNHLGKEPEEITLRDMEVLIDWIETAMAHLTEDSRIHREYADRLESLLTKESANDDD